MSQSTSLTSSFCNILFEAIRIMILKNKGVLVTGASQGISYAIARELANRGARVFLTARSEERLAATCRKISQDGFQAFYAVMDVSDKKSVETVVMKVQDKLSSIDILINNAGITSQQMVVDQDFAQAEREMHTNYLGTFLVTQMVLLSMLKNKRGMIVNVSSTIGKVPSPTQANYCASKAAIIAFSAALQSEVEDRGIQVRVFLPGYTNTEMTRSLKFKTPQPMAPEEVAKHMVKAIYSRKREYICGGANRGIVNLSRLFPEKARKIMKGIALKSFHA